MVRRFLYASIVTACSFAFSLPVHAECRADFNADGVVNGADLGLLLSAWGSCTAPCAPDMNNDGVVNGADLGLALSAWGPCPSPNWLTVLRWSPDPSIVTNATYRAAIVATGLPWSVRDNASGLEMILIAPGTFTMGASAGDAEGANISFENPPHLVTLTQPFYLGRYPVTQSQWQVNTGVNPSYFQPPSFPLAANNPVERVSWNDAQAFAAPRGLRLPTEAEFEYAARGGTTTSRYGPLNDIAWWGCSGCGGNSGGVTHTVGTKLANPYGLYDMIGNVLQWVQDGWGSYSASPVTDPVGPPPPNFLRIMRGSSFVSSSTASRVSYRTPTDGGFQDASLGVRFARTP